MSGADDEEGLEPLEPIVEIPIDGTLDLHLFRPSDAKTLIREYLTVCRERGLLDVHIIHGKGTGALGRTVHALLSRLPDVAFYRTADEARGGWGATFVRLLPPTSPPNPP